MEVDKVFKRIVSAEQESQATNEVVRFLKLIDNITKTSQWEYLQADNTEVMEKRSQMFFLRKKLRANFDILSKLSEAKPEINAGTFI